MLIIMYLFGFLSGVVGLALGCFIWKERKERKVMEEFMQMTMDNPIYGWKEINSQLKKQREDEING